MKAAITLTIASAAACGAVVASVPAICFDFDQVIGASVVDGRSGARGSVTGGGVGPLMIRGAVGGGLWFTGDGREGVTVPDGPEVQAKETLTIRAWLWPGRLGEHQGVVWKGDRGAKPERTEYKLSVRPDGRAEFGCQDARGGWASLISEQALPTRRWTLVTATFDKGSARLFFGQAPVATGDLCAGAGQGGKTVIRALPANDCPVNIGRFQQPGGRGYYPFFGGIDQVELLPVASGPPARPPAPPGGDPLDSLLLFEKEIDIQALAATPVLSGALTGKGEWLLEVANPGDEMAVVWSRGAADAAGRFRYLLDDYCGKLDLSGGARIRCRAYRLREGDDVRASGAEFIADAAPVRVIVDPEDRKQVLGPVSIYANAPAIFVTNATERRRACGPALAEMREAGVTHFDLAFGSLATIEPRNDDADPQRMDMDSFRANFKAQPEARTLMQFLRYLRGEGFTFGIRSTGFAPWQVPVDPATGLATHQVEEIAETWVALLRLMKEEDLLPEHLVPIWEPAYAPETVANICAATTRLARQHGFTIPIVGPYVIGTGGQSTRIHAMPDKFEAGAAYVRAYLKACGGMTPVIALEDYASGTPLIRPNLERMWQEVIHPLSEGRPRELWMIEYGAPCGLGPWNFYPSRWHGALSTWEAAFRLARSMNQLLDGGVSRFFFWKAWDSIGESGMVTPSSWGLIKGALHDAERRPPFYTARLYWRHLQEGAQVVGCRAERDLAVNAAVHDRQIAVFLVNPRSQPVTAHVDVAKTHLSAQARLLTATEEIQYQEREIYGQGAGGFPVTLAPRSINTLLCRRSASTVRFGQTRWPAQQPGVTYLSDLPWIAASTRHREMKPYGTSGMDVNWRRDETWTGEWLVHQAIRYRRGLTVMGEGEIQFAVPANAARFECCVGIDDGSAGAGPVAFSVKLDNRAVEKSVSLRQGDGAKVISVDLVGSKTITLKTEGKDSKANADWLEARFLPGPSAANASAENPPRPATK